MVVREELIPLTVPEVRRLLYRLLWLPHESAGLAVWWSRWRRRHQARALKSHYKRPHFQAFPLSAAVVLGARSPFDIQWPWYELDNSAAFGLEYCQIISDQFHSATAIVSSPVRWLITATVAQHGIGHLESPIDPVWQAFPRYRACLRSSAKGFDLVRSKLYRVSAASLIGACRSAFRCCYACRRTIWL